MVSATPGQRAERFYAELPVSALALSELLAKPHLFAAVPESWHVVITDVRQSTQALSDGMHHLVNFVATGSIIAALNIARRSGIRVPFFFGGDGATLIVPDTLASHVLHALRQHRDNTRSHFKLDLRVGAIPVADIYRAGHELHIAKARVTDSYMIPLILGQGLQHAEKVIKGGNYMIELPEAANSTLDLEGMQCRWDSIQPPKQTQEVLCLLVAVRDTRRQGEICSTVMRTLDDIFGSVSQRSPVAIERLRIEPTYERVARETLAVRGGIDLAYLLVTWLRTLLGYVYLRYVRHGRNYLRGVVQLSDTLMIDGRINTIIAGTAAQRMKLVATLDHLEAQGALDYGLHVCAASVMSCYVRDRRNDHVHFVDGIGGGYTKAAAVLKRKLAGTGRAPRP